LTINEALRRGITAVTLPSWTEGHLHIEVYSDGIEVWGQENGDRQPSWLENADDYTGHDGYVEYLHEEETV